MWDFILGIIVGAVIAHYWKKLNDWLDKPVI